MATSVTTIESRRRRDGPTISDNAGIIVGMELINFMCHGHLKLDFSTNVNFLVGNNGSGKSAVLVAIVTCLGASARFSNRSTKIGDLVKNGCNQATIRITLKNEGAEAFKPDEYGTSITVERKINKQGHSNYYIKSQQGQVISNSKDELERILEQFNIQVDNPCNVLMQETSKVFLAEDKPEKKYELFLKATQLEQMLEYIKSIKNDIALVEKTLTQKASALPSMAEHMTKLGEKVKALMELDSQKSKIKEFRLHCAWAHVQELEAILEKAEEEMNHCSNQKERLVQLKGEHIQKIAQIEEDVESKNIKLNDMRSLLTSLDGEIRAVIHDEASKRTVITSIQAKVDAIDGSIRKLKERHKNVQSQIKHLRSKGKGDQNEVYRANLAKAAKLKTEVALLEQQQGEIAARSSEMQTVLVEQQMLYETARSALGSKDRAIKIIQEDIHRLSSGGGKDKYAIWGANTSKIRELIQKNSKSFQEVPIGPVGLFVQLKDSKDAKIVEYMLGKFLDTYLVSSTADLKAFKTLCQKNQIEVPLNIAVRPFSNKKYQLSGLPDPKLYRTVLNVYECSDPNAYNYLIDLAQPENKILCDHEHQAKSIMFDNGKPPSGVRLAISMDHYISWQLIGSTQISKSVVKGGMIRVGMDSTAALKHLQNQLQEHNRSLQPAIEEERSQSQKLAALQKEQRHLNSKSLDIPKQRDRLMREIEELETPPQEEPDHEDEVKEMESSLESIETKIEEANSDKNKLLEEQQKVEKTLIPVSDKKDSLREKMETISSDIDKQARELDDHEKAKISLQSKLPKFDEAAGKIELKIAECKTKVAESNHLVETAAVKAQQIGPRPPQPISESSEVLRKKIERTEMLIETQKKSRELDDAVVGEFENARNAYVELKMAIHELRHQAELGTVMLRRRLKLWMNFRTGIEGRARALFIAYLSQRRFEGELKFNHDNHTLHIEIRTHTGIGVAQARDTSTLSGGEKSFSTVSLLLALWDTMESPFRAMDEFDVFMDPANREIALGLILDAAKDKPFRQHLFLTPQELSGVTVSEDTKIFKMRTAERNQRTISQSLREE